MDALPSDVEYSGRLEKAGSRFVDSVILCMLAGDAETISSTRAKNAPAISRLFSTDDERRSIASPDIIASKARLEESAAGHSEASRVDHESKTVIEGSDSTGA